jgi:hypothetical protein
MNGIAFIEGVIVKQSLGKHPNFFIIGAPKCGTTGLASYLAQHPEVFFSPVKEPNYYNSHLYGESYPFENYLEFFSKANPDKHKAIGEGSTLYLYSRECILNILTQNRNSKFIVMLRDPIEASVSLFNQSFKSMNVKRRERVGTFEEAWGQVEQRKHGFSLPDDFKPVILFRYDLLYSYSSYMKDLYEVVDPSKIFVIIYDDFKASNSSVFKKVCDFLNISNDFCITPRIVNPSYYLELSVWSRMLGCMIDKSYKIRRRLGLINLGWHRHLLRGKNVKEARSVSCVSEDTIHDMMTFYRPDIQKLEKIINRDLSSWYQSKYQKIKDETYDQLY